MSLEPKVAVGQMHQWNDEVFTVSFICCPLVIWENVKIQVDKMFLLSKTKKSGKKHWGTIKNQVIECGDDCWRSAVYSVLKLLTYLLASESEHLFSFSGCLTFYPPPLHPNPPLQKKHGAFYFLVNFYLITTDSPCICRKSVGLHNTSTDRESDCSVSLSLSFSLAVSRLHWKTPPFLRPSFFACPSVILVGLNKEKTEKQREKNCLSASAQPSVSASASCADCQPGRHQICWSNFP